MAVQFAITHLMTIDWDHSAFECLTIPRERKDRVQVLAKSYMTSTSGKLGSFVGEKEQGLNFLLYGEPGTGKTMTAVVISEQLEMPLYMASAGELGTTPQQLEDNLCIILHLVHHWNAIFLLDEADVFLGKRSSSDISRNALVSIFLRELDHSKGIMIFTTNRIYSLDPAFQSRIHVPLRYDRLNDESRMRIWKAFLDEAEMEISSTDLTILAKENINGRQIRNAMQVSRVQAKGEGKCLSLMHIYSAVKLAQDFERDLNMSGCSSQRIVQTRLLFDHNSAVNGAQTLKPCLDPKVYDLRRENHGHAVKQIPGTEEQLVLRYDTNFPTLTLKIVPHERLIGHHDIHIIWRDGDNEIDQHVDAGSFTISKQINNSELDEYFTSLSTPTITDKVEGSNALQLAKRLHSASRTFFEFFWLVTEGKGVYDRKGRKIPPYGVYIGIEARVAEYMWEMEKQLFELCSSEISSWPVNVLGLYQATLQEMRSGYEKWKARGNSDVSRDDLWNNPNQEILSAVIEAISKQLEAILAVFCFS
ncbi:hypothetical protein GP486_001962 [Trichoglossum hirsutum]|uniref:AAA+ ATPase domain-containing protein n=1 Tax=Trichoglossum hirsutum TaxID=265104 RepID=A0A9P8LFU0_9PEZI|nr:hypothetical protein GP486_001962 [Trichoglossum hirsutum]